MTARRAAATDLKLVPSQDRPLSLETLKRKKMKMSQIHPVVDYALIQPLVTTELATVKTAASTWAGSISTLVGLGGVFGLTVGKDVIVPLASGTLLGRVFVLFVVVLFGLGVVLAQIASQGSLHRSKFGVHPADPAEVLFRDTVSAIRSARRYMAGSRWLVGIAALATWLVLLWTVWALGASKVTPVYYMIEGPGTSPQCVSASAMHTNLQGKIMSAGIAVPAGASVRVVSSCPEASPAKAGVSSSSEK